MGQKYPALQMLSPCSPPLRTIRVFLKGWPRLIPQQKDPRHFYPLCFLSVANFWHMAMLRPSPQAVQLFRRAQRLWSRGSCTNQPPVVCRLCLLSAGSRGGPSGVSPRVARRSQRPGCVCIRCRTLGRCFNLKWIRLCFLFSTITLHALLGDKTHR